MLISHGRFKEKEQHKLKGIIKKNKYVEQEIMPRNTFIKEYQENPANFRKNSQI